MQLIKLKKKTSFNNQKKIISKIEKKTLQILIHITSSTNYNQNLPNSSLFS